MASFLDTLSDIVVSKEDIIQSEEFAKKYLSALFPDLDLRDNVALADLVIRPSAVLIAMIDKGLNYYFANNSIAGVTDDTPEGSVDRLLSNLFLERLTGTSAVIRARLYFLVGDRGIYVSVNNTFSADNENQFRPIVDTFISSSELIYDGTKDEWYYDMDLISLQQTEASNIDSGDLIYHTQVDPYFIQATVLYLSTKAIPSETNLNVVARSNTAVSTRNLINVPSIQSAVTSTFNMFTDIVSIGMGDVEMKRDLIHVIDPYTTTAKTLHVGGKVDVYVDSSISSKVMQYETDTSGYIYITAESGVQVSLRRATSVEALDYGLTDTIPNTTIPTITPGAMVLNPTTLIYQFQPLSDDNDYGLSNKQVFKVSFSGVTTVKTASFMEERVVGISSLQTYLEDSYSRVVCANYLARLLNTYYLKINIKKVGGVYLSNAELADGYNALFTYISSLRAGEEIVVTELLSILVAEAKIPNLDVTSVAVTYRLFDTVFSGGTGSITVSLNPARTFRFYLDNLTSV